MDPIRNPYAPGAGQRPPELAGRDAQLRAFDVVLERIAKGRPERSIVLTGLRGVGKTVLLNALRSAAVRAHWGTGKLEARPDQGLRRPLSAALHVAVRELGHPQGDDVDQVLGVIKAFAQRDAAAGAKLRDRWQPGIDAPAVSGRADSGDIEIDLVELLTDIGGLAADVGKGVAIFIDEMQDLGPDDVSALCAACHEISQSGAAADRGRCRAAAPARGPEREQVLQRAAVRLLPHRPARPRRRRPGAAVAGAGRRTPTSPRRRSRRCMPRRRATRTSSRPTARWPGTSRRAARSRPTTSRVAAPEAEAELAVGFFGSRYERATPAEREYLRAMADAAVDEARAAADGAGPGLDETESVPTAAVAAILDRKPQSLSPARDALLKKGLIYSGERGRIAFTVPHFGRYLRANG